MMDICFLSLSVERHLYSNFLYTIIYFLFFIAECLGGNPLDVLGAYFNLRKTYYINQYVMVIKELNNTSENGGKK